MNKSKTKEARCWGKWTNSGATGGLPEANMRLKLATPKKIVGVSTFYEKGQPTIQMLSIGRVNLSGASWRPEVYVVVPGNDFDLGQEVSMSTLPRRTKPVERVFPKKK